MAGLTFWRSDVTGLRVQLFFTDVSDYSRRRVHAIVALGQPGSNLRRGHRQVQSIEAMDARLRGSVVNAARPADHDELDRRRDVQPPFPCSYFGESVGSDQEKQLVSRV